MKLKIGAGTIFGMEIMKIKVSRPCEGWEWVSFSSCQQNQYKDFKSNCM